MKRMMMGCLSGRIRTANITNMVLNGNFVNNLSWAGTGAAWTASGNVGSFLANSAQDTLAQTQPFTSGRKYYLCATIRAYATGIQLRMNDGVGVAAVDHSGSSNYEFLSILYTAVNTSAAGAIYLVDFRSSGWNYIDIKYASMIDLTAAFGAGNEPSKGDMDAIMATYANSWLNGTQAATLYY